jgi:D-alanyl-D-alanine dipeptidase
LVLLPESAEGQKPVRQTARQRDWSARLTRPTSVARHVEALNTLSVYRIRAEFKLLLRNASSENFSQEAIPSRKLFFMLQRQNDSLCINAAHVSVANSRWLGTATHAVTIFIAHNHRR